MIIGRIKIKIFILIYEQMMQLDDEMEYDKDQRRDRVVSMLNLPIEL
jgi:hypothetical protein